MIGFTVDIRHDLMAFAPQIFVFDCLGMDVFQVAFIKVFDNFSRDTCYQRKRRYFSTFGNYGTSSDD